MKLPIKAKPVRRQTCAVGSREGISVSEDCIAKCEVLNGAAKYMCMQMC